MDPDEKSKVNVQKKLALRIVLKIVSIFIILGLLFFLPAGSLLYWEAWVYFVTLLIPAFFVISYFLRKDPEFLERRLLKRREKEKVHRSLQTRFSMLFILVLLIPGFDYRFHWSDVPIYIVLLSDLFVLIGYLIMVRVMKENRFASAIIETSKDQRVIDTGPYKMVRHPMYTGSLLFFLFTPLALGSWWLLIPFLTGIPLALVLRIINEEKYLVENLPGYKAYCRKVRFRMIPYIW